MCVNTLNEDSFRLCDKKTSKYISCKYTSTVGRTGATYLNVCVAESSNTLDFAPGDSWRFESQHRLEIAVELRYTRRHGCKIQCSTAYTSICSCNLRSQRRLEVFLEVFSQNLLL